MPYSEATLEHVWINIPRRTLKLLASDGVEEEIQWKFDEEGADGFQETITNIVESLPSEDICFVYK